MTIDDFYSQLLIHSRVFVQEHKKLHESDPERYPLDLPSELDWEEQFAMFQDALEE